MYRITKKIRDIKFLCQRITRGWDDSECWSVDYSFILFINSRLKVYMRDSKMIDKKYHKFKHKGSVYTLEDMIIRMIDISERLKDEEYFYFANKSKEEYDELLDIFKKTRRYIWW